MNKRFVDKLWKRQWVTLRKAWGKVEQKKWYNLIICITLRKSGSFTQILHRFCTRFSSKILSYFKLLKAEFYTVSTGTITITNIYL